MERESEVVQNDKGTRLRFVPEVTQAEAQLTDFSLRLGSHLKGKPIQEFGDLFERQIRKRVGRENKNLATRINSILDFGVGRTKRSAVPAICDSIHSPGRRSLTNPPEFASTLDHVALRPYHVACHE